MRRIEIVLCTLNLLASQINFFSTGIKMLKKICLLFMLFTSSVFAMNQINVTSESIVEGKINKIHACSKFGGRDSPVQIRAENVPERAKFLALVADDPDAVRPAGRVWVHWNVFNVSPTGPTFTLESGVMPKGDLGRTSGNAKGYEGMCPPRWCPQI
jgi:phosphatidylethanolamine-binding protein (PEBP) family uncharacterized protein